MKISNKIFILVALVLLTSLSSFGQRNKSRTTPELPIDSITGRITYSDVIYVDSTVDKQELFSRAREWFAKAFNSSTNVIQMEDKESGRIVGKALTPVFYKAFGGKSLAGYINYTISVYFKDGRYRYEITNFYHDYGAIRSGGFGACENMINTTHKGLNKQDYYNYFLYTMNQDITTLVESLKMAMIVRADVVKKDEW